MLNIGESNNEDIILQQIESNEDLDILIDSIDFSDESIFNIIFLQQ